MSPLEVFKLLSLLPAHPLEFCDQLAVRTELFLERFLCTAPTYQPIGWQEVIEKSEQCLGATFDSFLDEAPLAQIEREVRLAVRERLVYGPLPLVHNAAFSLARLCYVICRAIKPTIVLETGVAYGVTSAFILKALNINGHGMLHSVDRVTFGKGTEQWVGVLVPEALRSRWRLHQGLSKRIIPKLVPELGTVDFFLHDSRHTYRNIRWELQAIEPYLTPRAVVLADDVERNPAFQEWATRVQPAFWTTMKEGDKKSLLGIGAFVSTPSVVKN